MNGRGELLLFCFVFTSIVNRTDVINDGIVHLKGAGTVLVVRKEWMMAEIRGTRNRRQDFTRTVGRESS